jgi:glycosyltransferase involved in cell wall biosynthesis
LSLNPGGTERLVVELVKRLTGELPMAVCCLDDAGAWGEGLRADGVDVTALGRGDGFKPMLGRAVARVAADHRADVIHAHHYSPFVYSAIARLWRPNLRVVFTEHGRLSDAPPSAKRKIANSVLSLAPARVFTVSADLKAHVVAEGFPGSRVGVLYNGIDVGPLPTAEDRRRVRESLGLPDDTLVVGTVARLDPVKDLDTLVRATVAAGAQTPTTLLVIGDGSERRHLEQLTASLGATAQIRFLGHRDDARSLLAGCDVYANSSISEGISLTILEAMAAGLPVVATRVGGTPEILDDSCGRLVPARDPEAFANMLVELASRPAERAKLGRAARARVETRFTIERMVGEYREAYYQAAS